MTVTLNDGVAVTPSGEIATSVEVREELGITTLTADETTMLTRFIKRVEGSVRSFLRYDPVQAVHTEYHPQQPFQAQISRGIWEVMEQRAVLRQVSEAATNELQLQHLPIRSITSVHVDYDGRSESRATSFAASTLKTEGSDFWPNYDLKDSTGAKVCRDGILRTIGLWPTTPGTVKVVYTAGYTSSELKGLDAVLHASPIWEAVVDEACRRFRKWYVMKKGKLGLLAGVQASESLGSYSYSMDSVSTGRLFSAELTPDNKERLAPFVNHGWELGS